VRNFVARIHDRITPERAHDAFDRHHLVRGDVAQPGGGIAPDQRERIDHRAVHGVVGAEVERIEKFGHHAPVVSGVGPADRGAQAAAVYRPGLPLAHQVAQGLLAGDGEYDALRTVPSGSAIAASAISNKRLVLPVTRLSSPIACFSGGPLDRAFASPRR
jgi:hypothetical protein